MTGAREVHASTAQGGYANQDSWARNDQFLLGKEGAFPLK